MSNTTKIEITAQAKAFSGEGVQEHKFCIDLSDNSVLVWDSVAGFYTNCHILSESAKKRIRQRVLKPI